MRQASHLRFGMIYALQQRQRQQTDPKSRLLYLENVLVRSETKLLASNGEGNVRHLRQLVTVHNCLAAAQEGQRIAQTRQLVLNLSLCLIVGQGNLQSITNKLVCERRIIRCC